MKIENFNESERLEYFRGLYDNAKAAYADILDELEENMQQYRGSPEIDGSHERASAVRNITYEIIESQVSSDIPHPKVEPSYYTEKRYNNAVSIERLCTTVRDRLPFEVINDLDERFTYIFGGSIFFVEWDNTLRHGKEIGGVRVHLISPTDFIPQPYIYDLEDMDFCFLRFTTTRDELVRKYGASLEDIGKGESGSATVGASHAAEVIVCFYRTDGGEIGQFIFSGDLTLKDIPSYYKRKRTVCKKCSHEAHLCSCESPELTSVDISVEHISREAADGIAGEFHPRNSEGGITLPYYLPKRFPIVIRKNTSAKDSLLGQSDCRYIRPEQQAINKIESRILQKLLRSGVTPIIPEDASVSLNNSVFGQVIRMKPGESADSYGTVDTTPSLDADMREADRLYDHSKRILGISDAYLGMDDSYTESGISRQLKIDRATGRLESKRKMKDCAYAELDRIIFEHYLAFADDGRLLYHKDAYGRVHESVFSRLNFIEIDKKSGLYYYDDSYLFSTDQGGGAEYQREALWKRNLENLEAGTLGDKSDPVTLLRYWQCQQRAYYPHARENVEYFSLLVDEKYKSNYLRKENKDEE